MTSTDNVCEQVIANTAAVYNMAAPVLANSGERNSTAEKLSRAFRTDPCALARLGWSAGDFADKIELEMGR